LRAMNRKRFPSRHIHTHEHISRMRISKRKNEEKKKARRKKAASAYFL